MAAKKTSKKTLSKSAFIRSQSASLSAAEVVAKGKDAGIKFSSQLVYNVRGGSKPKRAAKKTSKAKPMATVTAMPKVSKADFVRANANLSPQEIVKKGKAEGLKLGISYVYNVRGYDKSKGKTMVTKQAARRSTARKALPVARPITTSSKAENLLRAVAAEVGLGRAIELLEAERARVHAVMRG